MDEEAIFKAVGTLNDSVALLAKKNDNKIFMSVVSFLIGVFILGMFTFWRTTSDNAIITKRDIIQIKTYSNHNTTIIEKTLNINLMHYNIKEK